MEFTSLAHKRLKDHFRDALEWLVQRKIHPTFDRDTATYAVAWRKLNDEVQGLANSKFISSGWKADFQNALRSRPYMNSTKIGSGGLGGLQKVCNREHPVHFLRHMCPGWAVSRIYHYANGRLVADDFWGGSA